MKLLKFVALFCLLEVFRLIYCTTMSCKQSPQTEIPVVDIMCVERHCDTVRYAIPYGSSSFCTMREKNYRYENGILVIKDMRNRYGNEEPTK
jgi:hypothetical protein